MVKVRIEREVCTGSGECARAVPDVFWMGDDSLAMVKEEAVHFGETRRFEDVDAASGFTAWARVPDSLAEAVDQAAAACPGMCIVVEHDEPSPRPEPEPEVEPEVAADEDPAPAPPRSSMGKRILYRLRHPAG